MPQKRQFILTIEVDETKVCPVEDVLRERTPFEVFNYLHSLVLGTNAAVITNVVLCDPPER